MSPIRLATQHDSAEILEIYSPYCTESSAVSFEIAPPSLPEMNNRITSTLTQLPWLVFLENEAVAGYVYAAPHKARAAYRWSVDTSIFVHSACRRRGVARALYAALFSILRRQGYFNAFAGITQPNAASVRLHESLGFRQNALYEHVGFKCGAWHDVAVFALTLKPPIANPSEPQPLSALKQSSEFASDIASILATANQT